MDFLKYTLLAALIDYFIKLVGEGSLVAHVLSFKKKSFQWLNAKTCSIKNR